MILSPPSYKKHINKSGLMVLAYMYNYDIIPMAFVLLQKEKWVVMDVELRV